MPPFFELLTFVLTDADAFDLHHRDLGSFAGRKEDI